MTGNNLTTISYLYLFVDKKIEFIGTMAIDANMKKDKAILTLKV